MSYKFWIIFILIIIKIVCCAMCVVENNILPKDNKMPHSHKEVCLVMKDIIMEYNTDDACVNEHILYYGMNATTMPGVSHQ